MKRRIVIPVVAAVFALGGLGLFAAANADGEEATRPDEVSEITTVEEDDDANDDTNDPASRDENSQVSRDQNTQVSRDQNTQVSRDQNSQVSRDQNSKDDASRDEGKRDFSRDLTADAR